MSVNKNKRICMVVQRYGLEVNGGAELLCRQLAEQLRMRYDNVTVLTSKAIAYTTWKDEYKSDRETINGVDVIRFSVTHPRKQREFDHLNAKVIAGETLSEDEEYKFVETQGPAFPKLIQYLRDNKENYDVFIFMTYLYYHSILGIKEVADKAIFIPTAHDEPYMRFKMVSDMFHQPRAFFFLTEEEKDLVHDKFHNEDIPWEIGGAGVDIPADLNADRFIKKYGYSNFIVYVGRVDEGKGCHILFQMFKKYKESNGGDLKLLLMGKPVMKIPNDRDIVSLGFVSDQDKYDGIKAASMLVLPSQYESLSIAVLEAMAIGTPVIVNGKCAVLKGHCIHSNGALWYTNYYEFEAVVNYYLQHPAERAQMIKNAKEYVDKNYQWDAIIDKLSSLIEKI